MTLPGAVATCQFLAHPPTHAACGSAWSWKRPRDDGSGFAVRDETESGLHVLDDAYIRHPAEHPLPRSIAQYKYSNLFLKKKLNGFSVCLERAGNGSVTRQQALKDLYSHVELQRWRLLEKQRYPSMQAYKFQCWRSKGAHGRAHDPFVIPLTNLRSTPLVTD